MREYTMGEMLRDCRCGNQDSNDLPPRTLYNPPSRKPTIRSFNLGLGDMLRAALGHSDDTCTREPEETKEKRGFGIGNMLREAVTGSGY